MSMDHKAYPFDHEGFSAELAPILRRALETGDVAPLVAFIEAHRDVVTDPYEGRPLPPDWQDRLKVRDAHEYGDYALTAYYRIRDERGLADVWQFVLEDVGNEVPGNAEELVLGTPFGPARNPFDPGKMGSFFRSAERAREDLAAVDAVIATRRYSTTLEDLARMLRRAVDAGRGLYVTF
ncbi:hypothetical protein Val02_68300 [Virgisporangium aliadipatigenens]|uniref:Uncharacterized protein n=1 Tax=Virgisporangium aliadipatigenens TaxID=741659 RepID=A0A8J4DTN5_9ACTN|nr:hypothetical protein [Virgisporangium aliadipatigenens]GIJ49944.1 hypothetical protein Val02_68300 [Virgisporangium aliadipatigenens]